MGRAARTDNVVGGHAPHAKSGATRSLSGIAPRHELVYEDLCARIRAGEYPLESQLPSERELTELYGVSRPTIRQALDQAEKDGIITKVPGRGNFVSRRRVSQSLSYMQTFRSVIASLDMQPSYSVLGSLWVKAQPEVAKRLLVPERTRVLQVDSVGLASKRPMAAYRSYLAPIVAEDVEPKLRLNARSTYELAAVVLGCEELRVEQTFEAVNVDEPTAGLLEISPGASAIRATSVFTTPTGDPIEFRTAIYPGGRYSFNINRVLAIGR